MQKPKMILFDYGQTLVDEGRFDGVKGTAEVMKYTKNNKYHKTPEQVQAEANAINGDLGRLDPAKRHLFQIEVHNNPFNAYLYESQGITLSISYEQAEQVFWNAATFSRKVTEGLDDFLKFLGEQGVRTGVISNIGFSGQALKARISEMLPNNHFEFIIASSEYVFRKPNQRIFNLALEKADLRPEEVWYVGDQYECDIVGAKDAGMFPVWYKGAIDFAQEEKEVVFSVNSWKELREILDSIK